jgi:hypothetical protein
MVDEELIEETHGGRIAELIKIRKDEVVEGIILPFRWANARICLSEFLDCSTRNY